MGKDCFEHIAPYSVVSDLALIAPFDVFARAHAALAVSRVCVVVGGVRAFAAPVFGASVTRFYARNDSRGACVNVVPRWRAALE